MTEGGSPTTGDYVTVADQHIWHLTTGTGHAVVLLHGAFAGASSWMAQTGALTGAGFRVFAPERRGHAHTADVPGPLSYSVMADDTIAYLETVVREPAHLVGWSDGAVVGLLVAQRRPDLVDRLVLIGQYFNSDGKLPGSDVEQQLTGGDAMDFLRSEYDKVSPDGPDHFPVVFEKTLAMIRSEPELDLAGLGSVTAQTLVLQGDRDEVTVEHSAAVAAAVADGRLAVLPGTHVLPIENAAVVNALLVSFLTNGPPAPLWG